jgi:transcriptional regulator with XRE-family HTH domain
MNLGQTVYRMFAGQTPTGRVRRPETPTEMIERGLREAGGVSQLARSLGVARTTVQRWNKGSEPSEDSVSLLRAALRRVDVSESRVARIAASDKLTLKGTQSQGAGRKPRARTIELGPYLAPGTMQRAADAFMAGASAAQLQIVVWNGIEDKAYRSMFRPPEFAGDDRQAREEASARAERLARAGSRGLAGSGGYGHHSGPDDGDEGEDLFDEEPGEYDDADYADVEWVDQYEIADGYEFSASSGHS